MARLIVIDGPDRGKEFELESGPEEQQWVAGRDPRLRIALADTTVSREHFRIEPMQKGFRLVDMGSRNRTFLNGEPVQKNLLRHGDLIAIGDSELRFEDEAQPTEVGEMVSTIIKEFQTEQRDSISRIINSLKNDPVLRGERIRRAVDGLRQLFTLSREILRTKSLDGLYSRLLEILVPALAADRGVVLHAGPEGWRPRAVYTSVALSRKTPGAVDDEAPTELAPLGTPSDTGRLILMSETVVQQVANQKKAVLSTDTTEDRRFEKGESIIQGGIASVIAAPILVGAPGGTLSVAGVLYLDRRATGSPFEEDDLDLLTAAADQAGEIVAHVESQVELRSANRTLIRSIVNSKRIIGKSPALERVHAFIRKAAPTPLTVLVRGETGTGKELVAAAIHYQSPRQGKPFVALNCAAMPENLVESELFGHEKGAFTSATTRKKGRFELADQGTIFLDEVGELSPSCQSKLLRLIEDKSFERVGGTETLAVDVRIIAATNKDLGTAIEAGEFRQDLFYRLNVLSVEIPPLRQRGDDVAILARHFLNELGWGDDRELLTADAMKKLRAYSWPGNIRQLRHVIESAIVLGDGPPLRTEDLRLPEDTAGGGKSTETAEVWEWQPESLEDIQKKHIRRVLEHTGGNKKRASEILGIERCTLYSKLKSYGITPKK